MTTVAEPEVAYTSVSADGTNEIDVDDTGEIIESRGFEDENAVPAEDPTPQAIDIFASYYLGLVQLFAKSNNNGKSVKTPDITAAMNTAAHYAYQLTLLNTGVR